MPISASGRRRHLFWWARESAGVPETVHDAADARLLIPMRPGMRSINVAQAAAMVLGEALRQTDFSRRSATADAPDPV